MLLDVDIKACVIQYYLISKIDRRLHEIMSQAVKDRYIKDKRELLEELYKLDKAEMHMLSILLQWEDEYRVVEDGITYDIETYYKKYIEEIANEKSKRPDDV